MRLAYLTYSLMLGLLCLLPIEAQAMPAVAVAVAASAASSAVAGSAFLAGLGITGVFASAVGGLAGFAVNALGSSIFGNSGGAKESSGFDSPGSFQAEARGRTQVVRSAVETRKWVLGEVMLSGPLVYAETTGTSNEYLHLVIPLSAHEVQEIGEIRFNDEVVGTLDGSGNVTSGRFADFARIKKHLGSTSQTADADLVAESAGLWTTDHRLRGVAYVYVRLKWSQDVYPNGIPNIKALVKGMKLYDPRSATTTYNNNWALGVRAYLMAAAIDGGLEADSDEVDDTVFGAAANTCDERVTMAAYTATFTASASTDLLTLPEKETTIATGDGVQVSSLGSPSGSLPAPLLEATTYYWIRKSDTTGQLAASAANALLGTAIDLTTDGSGPLTISHIDQARYTVNGTIDLGKRPLDILADLMTGAAGVLTYPAGTFRVFPAAYTTPTVTLDEDDLRGGMSVRARTPRAELFNAVRGTYSAPSNFWQPSDFPVVTNSTYEADDGGEQIFRDIELPFTTDPIRAQRLAKIHLEKSRQGLTVRMACKMTAFNLALWDTVMLDNTAMGWSAKVFRVAGWKLGADGFGIELMLREDTSSSYDWASGDATVVDPAPDTVLPSIAVSALSGLALSSGTADLFITGDGTVQSRIKASWTAVANVFVTSGGHIEVQFKKSADSIWQDAPDVDGAATQTYIGPVDDGVNYDVRARAVSTIGVEGAWATVSAHTVAGKSAAPTDPSGFVAQQSGPGTVLFSCDSIEDADLKRVEVRLLDFDDTTWANGIPVCNILKGFTSTTGAVPPGSWTFLARSFDTSENASDNTARADLEVTADGFTAVIDRQDYPDWLGTLTNMVKRYDGTLTAQSQSVAGGAFAEFNPAAVGTNAAIVGGLLVGTNAGAYGAARATLSKSTGKWEWRVDAVKGVLFGGVLPSLLIVGVGTASATLNNYIGADAYAIGYYAGDGSLLYNGAAIQTGGATYTTGDQIRVQLDHTLNQVKFYKNNVLQYTQALGTLAGTALYPMGATYSLSETLFLNTGKDGSFTPASGFSKLTADTIGFDTFDQFVPNPYTTCTYEAPALDKSIDGSLRIYADIVSTLGPGETTGIANPLHSIDYKLAAGSYDGFEQWTVGYADFRYLKTKLTLDTSVGNCAIRGFNTVADGQARQETGSNITVGASGQAVTFSRPFHTAPIVQARNEGATPLLPTVTGTSGTGATIHLYNTAGTEVGGTGGYTATGI